MHSGFARVSRTKLSDLDRCGKWSLGRIRGRPE